uniref:Uncharacterized protein n=1 Tax=Timema shepardi TaxID=629360 RepID=A0A7R9FYF9_TIMSH|nr:unnamed protein product [Timema shepardi]
MNFNESPSQLTNALPSIWDNLRLLPPNSPRQGFVQVLDSDSFQYEVSSLGLLRFYQEKHPLKLWIPPNSDFSHDTEWLITQFGEGIRTQAVLVTAPDVLTPHVLQQKLLFKYLPIVKMASLRRCRVKTANVEERGDYDLKPYSTIYPNRDLH